MSSVNDFLIFINVVRNELLLLNKYKVILNEEIFVKKRNYIVHDIFSCTKISKIFYIRYIYHLLFINLKKNF